VGRDDHELSGSTPAPVRYANRDAAGSQAAPYSVDGDYYLVMDLSYPIGEAPFSVPLTITVATDGAAGPGPTYARDPATYGATTTTAVAAPPARSAPPGSRLPGWALPVVAIGVAGIVAAAALAWRRRQTG
jgi:hypothetical protein